MLSDGATCDRADRVEHWANAKPNGATGAAGASLAAALASIIRTLTLKPTAAGLRSGQ